MSQDAAAPLPPRPRTILVVDDEPALLRLMAFLLQRKGYGMLTATNGEEALHVIREQRPDLVLLDIMMPRLDGYEVAEAIRADPATAEIPIVMLSAKAQDEDIERGLAAGVDSYITKPFDPEKLAEIVAAFLSGDSASPPEPAKRGS
jgi:two-component system, OmpR family, alkaline phosphatase synthesis response regulator PhoP